MLTKKLICSILLVSSYSFAELGWAIDRYTIQPIFLPNNSLIDKVFLNDRGDVAGNLSIIVDRDSNGNLTYRYPAFFWRNSNVTDLGGLGIDQNGNSDTTVRAVNNQGQVVGTSKLFDRNGILIGEHAFLWDKGVMQDLGTLGAAANGVGNSAAMAINASGQVVGQSTVFNYERNVEETHAVLWKNGTMLDVAPSGLEYRDSNGVNTSGAIGISDSGEVLLSSSVYYPTLFSQSATGTPNYDFINNVINYPATPIIVPSPYERLIFDNSRPLIWHDGTIKQLSGVVRRAYADPTLKLFFGYAFSFNKNDTILGLVPEEVFGYETNYYPAMWLADGSLRVLKGTLGRCLHSKASALGQVITICNSVGPDGGHIPMFANDGQTLHLIPSDNANSVIPFLEGSTVSIDINDKGQVAGSIIGHPSYSANIYQAYIYQDGVVSGLNDLIPTDTGWEIGYVYAINNAGQILVSGNKGYALLTPVANLPQASCDANQDGKVDKRDLSIMHTNRANLSYDIDGNGVVNNWDLRKCVLQCSQAHCQP